VLINHQQIVIGRPLCIYNSLALFVHNEVVWYVQCMYTLVPLCPDWEITQWLIIMLTIVSPVHTCINNKLTVHSHGHCANVNVFWEAFNLMFILSRQYFFSLLKLVYLFSKTCSNCYVITTYLRPPTLSDLIFFKCRLFL